MNINQMQVAIRPMSTAQAIDLGTMMARVWFVPLWRIWVGVAWPFFVLLYLCLTLLGGGGDSLWPMLGACLFWWCKPLYEKPMVTWLGYALFADPRHATRHNVLNHNANHRNVSHHNALNHHRVKQSIQQGFSSLRQYGLTLLVKKRLSTHRQLLLPILMLEHPDNIQLKQRATVLSRGQSNGLTWHTLILIHLETFIYLSVILVISQLIPTALMPAETYFDYLQYTTVWADVGLAVLYFFALSLIAPFFVAGGFAVYLTKRCLLEGWDVELTFKRLAQRYQQSQAVPLQGVTAPKSTVLEGRGL